MNNYATHWNQDAEWNFCFFTLATTFYLFSINESLESQFYHYYFEAKLVWLEYWMYAYIYTCFETVIKWMHDRCMLEVTRSYEIDQVRPDMRNALFMNVVIQFTFSMQLLLGENSFVQEYDSQKAFLHLLWDFFNIAVSNSCSRSWWIFKLKTLVSIRDYNLLKVNALCDIITLFQMMHGMHWNFVRFKIFFF